MIRKGLLCFLVFWGGNLTAQEVGRQRLIDHAAIEYLRAAELQSPLYFGKFQESQPRSSNHPYLNDAKYTNARLSYLQIVYPEALLRLDLSRDELVIISPDFRSIVLFPENVDYVDLHGQHIIYFRPDNVPGAPSQGYYTLLHSGNCKIMKKQTAVLTLKNNQSAVAEFIYYFQTRIYLYKDGVYQTIRSKRGLLNVLQPYKKELKRFISTNQLNYRHNVDAFLIRTINEYEKLSGMQ